MMKRPSNTFLRMLVRVGAALLVVNASCMTRAAGNWTVLSAAPPPGTVLYPYGVAVDEAGNLFVTDGANNRIQKRDAQGAWSVLTTPGSAPGQVNGPVGVAVDGAGNLYVAETTNSRIQKRDAQGNWILLATAGDSLGGVDAPWGVAVGGPGNLFVADTNNNRIQKQDAQGNWNILAAMGSSPGMVSVPQGVAVDGMGNLFVADSGNNRIQMLPGPVPGDIDGDGSVNLVDLRIVLAIILGSRIPTVEELQGGDVRPRPGTEGRLYGDGRIRVDDLNWIIRKVLGLVRVP